MALTDAGKDVDSALTREGHKGLAFENAFGGVISFLRRSLTKDLSGVDLAITGVPFDQAVTYRPGARFGPRAIREASILQTNDPPYGWSVDPMSDFDLIDYGDAAFDYGRPADAPAAIEAHVATILKAGAGALVLGGDHSVSLPVLRAQAAVHGPLALILFDAHSDLWPDDVEGRVDHGTWTYKAVQEGLIAPERSVMVGIRTVNPETFGITTLDAPSVHAEGPSATAACIRQIVGDHPAYVSFDIDCLDPAFAPGTGTPVWGGLSSWQAAAILRGLAGIDLRGGDVVEVAPALDPTMATAIAGAHAATEIACLYCQALKDRRG